MRGPQAMRGMRGMEELLAQGEVVVEANGVRPNLLIPLHKQMRLVLLLLVEPITLEVGLVGMAANGLTLAPLLNGIKQMTYEGAQLAEVVERER